MPFVKNFDQILRSHVDFEDGTPMQPYTSGINPNFRIQNPQQVLNAAIPSPFTNLFNTSHAPGYLAPIAGGGGTGVVSVLDYVKSPTGAIVGGLVAAVLIGLILKRR